GGKWARSAQPGGGRRVGRSGAQPQDASVLGIQREDVAGCVDGHTLGIVEAVGIAALGAPHAQELTGWGKLLDAVVAGVRNIHIASPIDRAGGWLLERAWSGRLGP